MKKLSAAAAAAILLTTPAIAANLTAPGREPVAISVTANGLDLTRAGGVDRLRARVSKAITEACKPGGNYQAYQTVDAACVEELTAKASPIVQQIASTASARHLASN